jgi:hypothetical protein
MHTNSVAEDRTVQRCYAVGILVGVLFWLTGCSMLPKPTGGEAAAVDPFHQSGPVGTAQAPPGKTGKEDAVASAAVPAPKPGSTVTSAAVPSPKPGPTMTSGAAAAKLLPPDTLTPGTATLVSGSGGAAINEGRPTAALQPPSQGEAQSSSPTLTLHEAIRQVQMRGVTSQELRMRDGKWRFTCEIPKPGDPTVSKFYEAEADRDVDAVQAVLARIEQDQTRP